MKGWKENQDFSIRFCKTCYLWSLTGLWGEKRPGNPVLGHRNSKGETLHTFFNRKGVIIHASESAFDDRTSSN